MTTETVTDNQSLTCSNPRCKKIFANPILVQNLSSEKMVSYSGCPYCLTEIDEIPECTHHFGYLSERSKGEETPDECMICKKTIECMLLRLRKSEKAIEEIKKWYC